MEDKLISAKALLDKLLIDEDWDKRVSLAGALADCIILICEAPAIEAKPIIHAHWNKDRNCTNCGRTYMDIAIAVWEDFSESEGDIPSWCPYCGARMDGKEKKNG